MYCASMRKLRRRSRQSSRKHKEYVSTKNRAFSCALFFYTILYECLNNFGRGLSKFLSKPVQNGSDNIFRIYLDRIESPPLSMSPVMIESSCGVSRIPLENQYCSRLISPPTMKA